MIGGLWKSAGSVALFAAAGLFVGGVAMPSAKAADLGGDCCADLEERVAELEATTVRKGNRRVSLTLYGWVNKAVLYWNDGNRDNTYFGVDNTNFATRFGLRGEARVNPNLKAGFSILIDVVSGANTSSVNQEREDNPLAGADAAGAANTGLNTFLDDHAMRMRDANVYLDHTQLGRLTLGHLTATGHQSIIDLGGVSVASAGAIALVGGGFKFANSATGALTTATIAANTDNVADWSHRIDAVRWDSPSLGGLIIGLSAGEAANIDRTLPTFNATNGTGPIGLYWAANLRYAGEFAGFRVAAAVSYENSEAEEKSLSSLASGAQKGPTTAESNTTGASLSLLHVPSGLFAQGQWVHFERANGGNTTDDGTLWQIQGGIAKNYTGLGNTALYGEYAKGTDLQRTFVTDPAVILGNEYTMWGLGIVQNIDAASMELYLAFRNHSLDRDAVSGVAVDDIQTVIGGMRIGF